MLRKALDASFRDSDWARRDPDLRCFTAIRNSSASTRHRKPEAETRILGDAEARRYGDMEIETMIGSSEQTRRDDVAVSLCSRISVSPRLRVSMSPRLCVPVSTRLRVSASPPLRVSASPRLRVFAPRFFSILFTYLLILTPGAQGQELKSAEEYHSEALPDFKRMTLMVQLPTLQKSLK